MSELPAAAAERARVQAQGDLQTSPLAKHLLHGLAYTAGSALGSDPPTHQVCLSAFMAPATKTGLTAGAKAWSKHAHRSGGAEADAGWWGGQPKGPVASVNERALLLLDKVVDNATWRNLHWLPHQVLVYEVRTEQGYGLRWSQQHRGPSLEDDDDGGGGAAGWTFRGFVEPMMENGHEVGWKH